MTQKIFFLLTSLVCISFAFADSSCEPCNTCSCNPCCCKPCDYVAPCPPDICAYNAPFNRDLCCGWGVITSASYLYWQAKEDNLEPYAQRLVNADRSSAAYVGTLDFSCHSAFQVELGIDFGCDHWQTCVQYTRYHHDAGKNSISIIPTADPIDGEQILQFFPLFTVGDMSIAATRNLSISSESILNTTWNLKLDVVDGQIKRSFYVGKCLIFSPFAGLKGAWIDQKITQAADLFYQVVDVPPPERFQEKSFFTTKSSAVGPRMGMNTDWLVWCDFRFVANMATSLLYTEYKIQANDSDGVIVQPFNSNEPVDFSAEISLIKQCALRPVLELGIGLGWGSPFFCNKWYFDIEVRYDAAIYWSQNVFPQYTIFPSQGDNALPNNSADAFYFLDFGRGDLFLHGLTVKARIEF